MYKMHHPKSDEDRLYLPRTEGGRGLIKLELSYKTTTIAIDKYFLHFVKDPDDRKSLYSISRQSMKGLGLAWRTNRSPNVEQEAVIAIFHLYTPLMSSKRKGRSSAASQSSNQSPEEKRSKNSETDEVFEALEMAEDVGLKLQRVLDKLEKLDKIEAHLSWVSASLASIEEKVSRLDEDVQDLKQKTNRVEKKASELEASIQFNKRRHFRPKERVKV